MVPEKYEDLLEFLTEGCEHSRHIAKKNFKPFNDFLISKGLSDPLPADFLTSHNILGELVYYFTYKGEFIMVVDARFEYVSGGEAEFEVGGFSEIPIDELNSLYVSYKQENGGQL